MALHEGGRHYGRVGFEVEEDTGPESSPRSDTPDAGLSMWLRI
jgi:hypothetical protein